MLLRLLELINLLQSSESEIIGTHHYAQLFNNFNGAFSVQPVI